MNCQFNQGTILETFVNNFLFTNHTFQVVPSISDFQVFRIFALCAAEHKIVFECEKNARCCFLFKKITNNRKDF